MTAGDWTRREWLGRVAWREPLRWGLAASLVRGGLELIDGSGGGEPGSGLMSRGEAAEPGPFIIETPRPGDRVEVLVESLPVVGGQPRGGGEGTVGVGVGGGGAVQPARCRVVLAVHSERGIGSAIVTRRGPTWPGELVIRWHLRGLESFELQTGQGELAGSLGEEAGQLRSRLWRDGREERLLQPGEDWFTTLRVCQTPPIAAGPPQAERAGKPAGGFGRRLPLENGHLEMRVPGGLLAGETPRLELRWVDFHR